MVDAGLHPADVVAHDEEDIGFLWLLRGRWDARRHYRGDQSQQTEPDDICLCLMLDLLPRLSVMGRQPVPDCSR